MDHHEFEELLSASRLGCTPERFEELRGHLVAGGGPPGVTGTYIEVTTGQPVALADGDALAEGTWVRLDDPVVRQLVEQGVLASGVPTKRPY